MQEPFQNDHFEYVSIYISQWKGGYHSLTCDFRRLTLPRGRGYDHTFFNLIAKGEVTINPVNSDAFVLRHDNLTCREL